MVVLILIDDELDGKDVRLIRAITKSVCVWMFKFYMDVCVP